MTSRPSDHSPASDVDANVPTLPAWMAERVVPPPRRVGRYAIAEQLGEGGMGVVLAGHDPVLDRRVAIKLLHARDDDARAAARMVREAQALAKLSHPNIVPVYEAGEADGLLFLAMELVEGRTLREVQGDDALPWRECIALYLQAGEGLAAAHAAGFVHRDFKPSNVLVGDDGRVRVVDFGLARAAGRSLEVPSRDGSTELGSDEEQDGRLTRTGAQLGTPAYMSPEQRAGEDVDARSDQFSFCVALWEGLYGVNPTRAIFRAEVERRPPRMPTPAREPAIPARLRKALRRGMAVEAGERWPDMPSLLAQLRPRSPGRRLWVAGASVAVALGAAWLTRRDDPCASIEADAPWTDAGAVEIRDALVSAHERLGPSTADAVVPALEDWAEDLTAARLQSCRAHADGSTAPARYDAEARCLDHRRARFDALLDTLQTADAAVVLGAVEAVAAIPSPTMCMDAAVLDADAPPPDDPEVAAEVERARDELARIETQIIVGRPVSDELSAVREQADATAYAPLLAEVDLLEGQLADSEARYVDAAQLLRAAFVAAEASEHDAVAAEASAWLIGVLSLRLGRPDLAQPWAEVARAKAQRKPGLARVQAYLPFALGLLAEVEGRDDEARTLMERALELRRASWGETHPAVATTIEQLAQLARRDEDFDEAEALFEDVVARRIETFGEAHPMVARARANVALVLADRGQWEEALRRLEAVLADLRKVASSPTATSTIVGEIAELYDRTGKLDAAADAYAEAIAAVDEGVGSGSMQAATLRAELSGLEGARGNYEEAERLAVQALAVHEAALGPDHPSLGPELTNLGIAQQNLGRLDAAAASYERSLQIQRTRLGPRNAAVAVVLVNLGTLAIERGRLEEAQAYLLESVSIQEEALGAEHPSLAHALYHLGAIASSQGRHEDAQRWLSRAASLPEIGDLMRGEVRFALAQALYPTAPERAREVVEEAARSFEAAGEAGFAEQVRAWTPE